MCCSELLLDARQDPRERLAKSWPLRPFRSAFRSGYDGGDNDDDEDDDEDDGGGNDHGDRDDDCDVASIRFDGYRDASVDRNAATGLRIVVRTMSQPQLNSQAPKLRNTATGTQTLK